MPDSPIETPAISPRCLELLGSLVAPEDLSGAIEALIRLGLIAAQKKCLTEQELEDTLGQDLLAAIVQSPEP